VYPESKIFKQATHNNSSLMDKPANMSKQKQTPRGKVRFHENELVRPAA